MGGGVGGGGLDEDERHGEGVQGRLVSWGWTVMHTLNLVLFTLVNQFSLLSLVGIDSYQTDTDISV